MNPRLLIEVSNLTTEVETLSEQSRVKVQTGFCEDFEKKRAELETRLEASRKELKALGDGNRNLLVTNDDLTWEMSHKISISSLENEFKDLRKDDSSLRVTSFDLEFKVKQLEKSQAEIDREVMEFVSADYQLKLDNGVLKEDEEEARTERNDLLKERSEWIVHTGHRSDLKKKIDKLAEENWQLRCSAGTEDESWGNESMVSHYKEQNEFLSTKLNRVQ